MATQIWGGPRTWSAAVDDDGVRTYKIIWQIRGLTTDGPASALLTPGLPLIGAPWQIANDVDLWVWRRPQTRVEPRESDGSPNRFWDVELTFSNRPPDLKSQRCWEIQIENPLLEPARVSGGFIRRSVEATLDRFDVPILTSSWEPIRGPTVEFDDGSPSVRIEQNVATALQAYQLPYALMHAVNTTTMWGLPRRTIKLSNFTWERKYWGLCYSYYTRVLDFEVDYNTWDRDVADVGNMALQGNWSLTGEYVLENVGSGPPNPNNPAHFKRFTDRQGNPCRVFLNGKGLPASAVVGKAKLFMSLQDDNVGKPLSNTDWWFPIAGELSEDLWTNTWHYSRGNVVLYNGAFFIAEGDSLGAVPPLGWLGITDFSTGLSSAGDYNAATTYSAGQYVRDASGVWSPGYRHVEKYKEANLFLLGVPATF